MIYAIKGLCDHCGKCCLSTKLGGLMLENPCIELGEDRCKFYVDEINDQLYGHCLIFAKGVSLISTVKDSKGNKKAQTEPADRQDSGEATEPETAGQLFNWIMSQDKNIKVPRAWIEAEYGVSHGEALTIETIQELYNQIKADKEW